MTNIWDFLLQTIEVSLTAALILLLKQIFQDKLSPRWQYAAWLLLAGKLLVPTGAGGHYLSSRLAAWILAVRAAVESGGASQYAGAYTDTTPDHVLPVITDIPASATDWLFLIYAAGAALWAVRYAVSYVRLRVFLNKGCPPEKSLRDRVCAACDTLAVRPCRITVIDGIESAFVCGIFRPVLAVPAQQCEDLDEKILLHEMLHRKHFDAVQNVFWCLMRCLHWCNPFLQYVFSRIGNDMESLCDQRVLERLEGEERRAYGMLLLDMTDRKYARAIGTTSISNGGKNIARRIQAVARFRKYPRGMALVSVCILLVAAVPVFGGTAPAQPSDETAGSFAQKGYLTVQKSMAEGRMTACTTQAGAIDTFVKGLVFDRPAWLASVLPLEEMEQMTDRAAAGKFSQYYNMDIRFFMNQPSEYYVTDLQEKNGTWTGRAVVLWNVDEKEFFCRFPFAMCEEDGRWTVWRTGKASCAKETEEGGFIPADDVPSEKVWTAEGETGTVRVEELIKWCIEQPQPETQSSWFWSETNSWLLQPVLSTDARFAYAAYNIQVDYSCTLHDSERQEIEDIQIDAVPLQGTGWDEDQASQFDLAGTCWTAQGGEPWDGTLHTATGGSFDFESGETFPSYTGYAVTISIHGKERETITVKRGEGR